MPRSIGLALDLARMPALIRTGFAPPIPEDVLHLIRVAAEVPEDCALAAAETGQAIPTIVEAARFFIQQVMFRPEADCYRTLGLIPGASREQARTHMRLLLRWLHPDRRPDLDAVYAERVLQAWREISGRSLAETESGRSRVNRRASQATARRRKKRNVTLSWVETPRKSAAPSHAAVWYQALRVTLKVVASLLILTALLQFAGWR